MIGRVIMDVVLCSLATVTLVGVIVAGHLALRRGAR
jgi:predicted ATP-grasp superfamily ATP-dependent carboligase